MFNIDGFCEFDEYHKRSMTWPSRVPCLDSLTVHVGLARLQVHVPGFKSPLDRINGTNTNTLWISTGLIWLVCTPS